MSPSEPAIDAVDLRFDYETGPALTGTGFTAPKGEITALVGPNGAGKTTLMRILSGLLRPQTGRATVLGLDVAGNPRAVRRRVGYLADFIGLWDRMTVAQHLDHAGRCAGLTARAIRSRRDALAAQLDLEELAPKEAGALSRGQRQRVAIAQALVKEPELLILDEPASGLDPEARRSLSKLLLSLKKDGATLLISSHILSELDDYSDRIVVIRDGRIQQAAALQDQAASEVIDLTLATPQADLAGALRTALDRVVDSSAQRIFAPDRAEIDAIGGPVRHAEILAALIRADLPIASFTPRRRKLEDAYFSSAAPAEEARP